MILACMALTCHTGSAMWRRCFGLGGSGNGSPGPKAPQPKHRRSSSRTQERLESICGTEPGRELEEVSVDFDDTKLRDAMATIEEWTKHLDHPVTKTKQVLFPQHQLVADLD